MTSAGMLKAHPHPIQLDSELLTAAVDALVDCAQACDACADACLAEDMLTELRRCIRLDLDCADICRATAAVFSRQTDADWRVMRSQLAACITACAACASECEQHAAMHAHCRICAAACRACERACDDLLDAMPTAL